jgi:uncharacterized membrane protein YwaF
MPSVIWWIIVGLVLFTTIVGFYNGFNDWSDNKNLGERMVTIAVLGYGFGGAILVFAMLRKRKWVMIPLIVWSIAVLFAAIAAPYVYSDEAKWISTITSGIFIIALLTFIALRVRKEASSW